VEAWNQAHLLTFLHMMVLSKLFHSSYNKYNPNGITVGLDFVKPMYAQRTWLQ